jgi:hypothetical protein
VATGAAGRRRGEPKRT